MSLQDRLMEKAAGYTNDMVEMQTQLTALKALGPTNGGEGELAKAELAQKMCRDLGLEIERIDAPDPRVPCGFRPNFVATMQGKQGPAIWVLSHLDVVPEGPLELWESDPYTVRQEGDYLYGRGVLDDQAGFVGSYFGLKTLIDLNIEPKGKIGLILVSDEETGSEYGLGHILKARPDLFSKDDLIIVPDSGQPDGGFIEISEKSSLWLKVDVFGKQTHASRPQNGVNALLASAHMMVAVPEVRAQFPLTDDLFVPNGSTMEPTRKEAGVPNINTVPGHDCFYIDCRILPQISIDEVQDAFQKKFEAIAEEQKVTFKIKRISGHKSPLATPEDAPVVIALKKAINKVAGIKAKAGGIGGGTVAALFREQGIPAAVWATFQDTAHTPNEFCLISNLIQDAKIFATIFAGSYE